MKAIERAEKSIGLDRGLGFRERLHDSMETIFSSATPARPTWQ